VLAAAAGRAPAVQLFGTDYETPDGTCIRDYVHIADLAAAHLLALAGVEEGRHHVYNLGSGRGYSVREVIDAARRVTGRDFKVEERPRRPGDSPRLVASSERIRERLGWVPQHGLEEIVRDAWEWMQEHPRGYE
jgi:UDP-glucose 4-epimerase